MNSRLSCNLQAIREQSNRKKADEVNEVYVDDFKTTETISRWKLTQGIWIITETDGEGETEK